MSENKKVKELITDLFSTNPNTVMGALSGIRTSGDLSVIEPMLTLYCTTASEEIKDEIADIMMQVKVKNAINPIMMFMNNARAEGFKAEILSFVWEAGLAANRYLTQLVQLALEESFDVGLECLTIVENETNPFPQQEIKDCVIMLKRDFEDDEEKHELIKSMQHVLKALIED